MQKLPAVNTWSAHRTLPIAALSALAFLTSCGRVDDSLAAAAAQIGAERAEEVSFPDYPPDCRRTSAAGLTGGERLDEAVLLYDAALTAQNRRTARCAQWYDDNFGEPR